MEMRTKKLTVSKATICDADKQNELEVTSEWQNETKDVPVERVLLGILHRLVTADTTQKGADMDGSIGENKGKG